MTLHRKALSCGPADTRSGTGATHPSTRTPFSPAGVAPVALTVRRGRGFLGEAVGYVADLIAAYRIRRQYRELLDVEALADILRDLRADIGQAAARVYTAEQADIAAAQLLERVLDDGRVTAAEIPHLQAALRHILNSAAADHDAGEQLA